MMEGVQKGVAKGFHTVGPVFSSNSSVQRMELEAVTFCLGVAK